MELLPLPKSLAEKPGNFYVRYDTKIVLSPSCGGHELHYAKCLQHDWSRRLGYRLPITRAECPDPGDVNLLLEGDSDAETYRLQVEPTGVTVRAPGTRGLLYGVQTLRQFTAQYGAALPCVEMEDAPDFPNRGFYHDATRGRVPTLHSLKELADRMAYFKLNQLQIYMEHTYQFAALTELWRDDTPLTAQEILELDEYCRALNIELVPSFSTFGHLHKLLSAKGFSHLCEMEGSEGAPLFLTERMMHHTLDVTNPGSIALVRDMLLEVMPLFSSRKVNICADETFDLGKGRSKSAGAARDTHQEYIDFLKKICDVVTGAGKTPMFWGDILLNRPEMVRELPKEAICLNWGYDAAQSEDGTRLLYEAGAVQYCCPGVSSWMRFISRSDFAYENITRMCGYARKYNAAGILNTDWGDLGHINPPHMSIPGLVYGAMFSWNGAPIPMEDAARAASRLAYGDRSGQLVATGLELSRRSRFDWNAAVHFQEILDGMAWSCSAADYLLETMDFADLCRVDGEIAEKIADLYALIPQVEESARPLVYEHLLMADGIRLFNSVGAHMINRYTAARSDPPLPPERTAAALERWWLDYRALWRAQSKESELVLLQKVINRYGDILREMCGEK